MKELIPDVNPPETVSNQFIDLGVQIAASVGCGGDLYLVGQRIVCAKDCANCKAEEILLKYDKLKGNIAQRDKALYEADIERYNLYPLEEQKKPTHKHTLYKKIA